jgi:hemin uptake protein HemP
MKTTHSETSTAEAPAPSNTVAHSRQGAQAPPLLRSKDLLGGAPSVGIEHLGQIYRLQSTRAGKLILTK